MTTQCTVDDCGNQTIARGLCGKHYQRWAKYGDVNYITKPRRLPNIKCSVEDCDDTIKHSNGLCDKHWHRQDRTGSLETTRGEYGLGCVSDSGYYLIRINGFQVKEHIKVMEDILGRKLTTDEVVHHIDGDRLNNDPSNLEVMSRSAHTSLHNRLRYASN